MVPNTQLVLISVVRLNSIRTEFEKKIYKLEITGKKKKEKKKKMQAYNNMGKTQC